MDLALQQLAREAGVVVTVLATKGSVPRGAGTRMVVFAQGEQGTIGGGHLEYQAIAHARLLLAGHAIRYQANASVYHSHSYSLRQELGRYFDTGVFHAQQHWLIETFGSAANEGIQFIRSEMNYLIKKSAFSLPEALLRNLMKYAGFKTGQLHANMPQWLAKGLSMHKGYWV